jgi:hypothetical protein
MSTVLGFAVLMLLVVAVLPVPRVRQWLLSASARLGRGVVLACLGACGTFFADPRAAPEWLTAALAPLVHCTLGLSLDAGSGLPWLLLAVAAVAVALPVLMAVELGLNLAAQTAQVQSLRKEMRQAAAWVDARLAAIGIVEPPYPPLPSEAAAAVEALRAAGKAEKAEPATGASLVMDYLR